MNLKRWHANISDKLTSSAQPRHKHTPEGSCDRDAITAQFVHENRPIFQPRPLGSIKFLHTGTEPMSHAHRVNGVSHHNNKKMSVECLHRNGIYAGSTLNGARSIEFCQSLVFNDDMHRRVLAGIVCACIITVRLGAEKGISIEWLV